MQDHAAYWTALAAKGTVIVFGPVADPRGVWGVAVLAAEDEAQVESLTASDPVIKSGLGATYEVLPMLSAVIGKKRE